jgi:hypothetical protein
MMIVAAVVSTGWSAWVVFDASDSTTRFSTEIVQSPSVCVALIGRIWVLWHPTSSQSSQVPQSEMLLQVSDVPLKVQIARSELNEPEVESAAPSEHR